MCLIGDAPKGTKGVHTQYKMLNRGGGPTLMMLLMTDAAVVVDEIQQLFTVGKGKLLMSTQFPRVVVDLDQSWLAHHQLNLLGQLFMTPINSM